MKKLFKNAAMALACISFFATSCEKEKAAPPAAAIGFKTTSTPKGTNNPTVVNGDSIGVTAETFIRIEPGISDEMKKCKGKWSHTVEGAWTNADYSSGFDTGTGVLNFIPKKPGTYRIKFTYTCPDGSSTSGTIIIMVS